MANQLQYEKSPYLLQHSENPVNWYPWGAAAFQKAQREDKPVFLSMGPPASDAERLIARFKEAYDSAVPSGNSIEGTVL